MVKKIDVETREAQEELDSLKAEERTQRKLNDALHAENRKLEKEDKGLKIDIKELSERVSRIKATLKKLKDNEDAIDAQTAKEKADIAETLRELEKIRKVAEDTIVESDKKIAALAEKDAATNKKSDTLKSNTEAFAEDKAAVEQTKKEYAKLLNDVEVDKERVTKIIAQRAEALADTEKKNAELDNSIEDVKNIKEQHRAKKEDCVRAEKETLALNDNLVEAQAHLDKKNKEADKEKEFLAAQIASAEAEKKSYMKLRQALSVRAQEVERDELRVNKLIRENNLTKEIDELRQEK